jgi:hypothetical protein
MFDGTGVPVAMVVGTAVDAMSGVAVVVASAVGATVGEV